MSHELPLSAQSSQRNVLLHILILHNLMSICSSHLGHNGSRQWTLLRPSCLHVPPRPPNRPNGPLAIFTPSKLNGSLFLVVVLCRFNKVRDLPLKPLSELFATLSVGSAGTPGSSNSRTESISVQFILFYHHRGRCWLGSPPWHAVYSKAQVKRHT